MSYSLRSEVGEVSARVHPYRIRRISKEAMQTAYPKGGIFPDRLRLLQRTT